MPIKKVVICDDDTSRAARWKKTVKTKLPDAEVTALTGIELATFVRALDDEEQRIRSGAPLAADADRTQLKMADEADLVLLDSDLSPQSRDLDRIKNEAERHEVALTLRNGYGDTVARQLRSYTNAGLLVVVNMFWGRLQTRRVFDLTLTQASFAAGDLHLKDAEIEDAGVWLPPSDVKVGAYLPWQRQNIPDLFASFERSRTADLDLSSLVLETLEIDPMKLTARQLDVFDKDPNEITFKDLAFTRLGFKYPDKAHSPEAIDRMARSVARHWLERFVIPAQNVLLDAPHLFERYWRLLEIDPDAISEWTATRNYSWADAKSRPGATALNWKLEPFISRPVYDEELARKAVVALTGEGADSRKSFTAGFAEDVSAFYPLEEIDSFPTDVSGPFSRRWAKQLDGVGYEPSNRLLL
jgi:hypothetical protein